MDLHEKEVSTRVEDHETALSQSHEGKRERQKVSGENLSSTESVCIDLVAMRNWHFKSSMDTERRPEMRRWHRRQSELITRRIRDLKPDGVNLVRVAMVELLAGRARDQLHRRVRQLAGETPDMQEAALGFEWRQVCEQARRKIAECERLEPSNSQHKSFGCDIEGTAAASSPPDAAANKTGPSPAKA